MGRLRPTPYVCECGKVGWATISNVYVCFVDADQAPILGIWSWYAFHNNGNTYVMRSTSRTVAGERIGLQQYLHALLCPAKPGLVVDHKNGNGLDNRQDNLEPVTSVINTHRQRKKKSASSKYKGVSLFRGRWRVTLQKDRRQIYIGAFQTEEEAAAAYNQAAVRVFGRYARLNTVIRSQDVA